MSRMHNGRRTGFTLVELLVVISIIAILVGLTAVGVAKFRSVGPQKATESNIRNIKGAVDKQWSAVVDAAKTDKEFATWAPSNGLSAVDPTARVQYISAKLSQAFPTTFAEMLTPAGGLPPHQAYTSFLSSQLNITTTLQATANTTPIEVQQAICLMMALHSGPKHLGVGADTFGTTAVKQLAARNASGTVVGVNGFIDAFGKELLFRRAVNGEQIAPVILSAGRDGKYGVNTVTQAVTIAQDAQDNISSLTP